MRVYPGRHEDRGWARSRPSPRELLPWLPTVLGVCALIVLLIIAAGRFSASPEVDRAIPLPTGPAPTFGPPPPPPPVSASASATPSASAGPDRQVTASTSPRPTRTSTRTSPPPTTTAPAPGPVGGRYSVIDSFGDGFIGEVLVGNTAARDSDWRVELRFPAAVGELITSWVESAPQASLRRSGSTYIWSSGVPVPASAQVALRFHFARSGTGNLPSSCTVNDQRCTGIR